MSTMMTMTTPSYMVGAAPPVLDATWLPSGSAPLSGPLGSTISVDPSLVAQLVLMGFVPTGITTS